MNNLPKDLLEEVFFRVPVESIKKVRLTCRKWNTLSKDKQFAKKHFDQAIENKFMVVIMINYRIHLIDIESTGKRFSLDDSIEVDICKVYHCYGLLLCITKDHTKLVVWNLYWGQTRCIQPKLAFRNLDLYSYAIGYNKSSCIYKILTFIDSLHYWTSFVEIKIYDLNSYSWKVLDVAPNWNVDPYNNGFSLNGDTYWIARGYAKAFLVCFDFTEERFGLFLPLPFEWYFYDTHIVTLSCVREEKLAVLLHNCNTLMLEIWITTEIKPNTVSWSSEVFLAVVFNLIIWLQVSSLMRKTKSLWFLIKTENLQ